MHVRVWHASSLPAQSVGATHSTQLPRPSHTVPPAVHGLPAWVGWWRGTPPSQTSAVQGLPPTTPTRAPPQAPAEEGAVPPVPPAPLEPLAPLAPAEDEAVVSPPPHPSEQTRRPKNSARRTRGRL